MNNTPNRASNPAGKSRRKEISFDLTTVHQMLPLVKSIVTDLVGFRTAVNRLTPERDRLDRHRRDLVWQERQRRYQVSEEISAVEKSIVTAIGELTALGVSLIDGESGEVDFPTRINGRSAAFNWKLSEDAVAHWHYADEDQRRPIPTELAQGRSAPVRFRGQP